MGSEQIDGAQATIDMEDLNDIYFFASVVQYGGFFAAARKIGVEKTRLSRRIAALEKPAPMSVYSSAPLGPWR